MPLQKSLGVFSEIDCSRVFLQINSLNLLPCVLAILTVLVLRKAIACFILLLAEGWWGAVASLLCFKYRGTLEAGRTVGSWVTKRSTHQELGDWLFSPSKEAGYSVIVSVQVAALLSGEFQGLIEKFYIIDCRYPYEYLGGHIQVRLYWGLSRGGTGDTTY